MLSIECYYFVVVVINIVSVITSWLNKEFELNWTENVNCLIINQFKWMIQWLTRYYFTVVFNLKQFCSDRLLYDIKYSEGD